MHWTDEFSSAGAIARLVHDETDPSRVSRPERQQGPVSAVEDALAGIASPPRILPPDLGESVFWSKAPVDTGFASISRAGLSSHHSSIRKKS
jgi:hypothetical protein